MVMANPTDLSPGKKLKIRIETRVYKYLDNGIIDDFLRRGRGLTKLVGIFGHPNIIIQVMYRVKIVVVEEMKLTKLCLK